MEEDPSDRVAALLERSRRVQAGDLRPYTYGGFIDNGAFDDLLRGMHGASGFELLRELCRHVPAKSTENLDDGLAELLKVLVPMTDTTELCPELSRVLDEYRSDDSFDAIRRWYRLKR